MGLERDFALGDRLMMQWANDVLLTLEPCMVL